MINRIPKLLSNSKEDMSKFAKDLQDLDLNMAYDDPSEWSDVYSEDEQKTLRSIHESSPKLWDYLIKEYYNRKDLKNK